jgi:hypothetical protein
VDNRAWWPHPDTFWPAGVPGRETIAAFVSAFATLGYVPCADGVLETAFERVALYADLGGTPTHAARQLPDGSWTSKLGEDIDISHAHPAVLNGPLYGSVVQFLRRPRPNASIIAI